MFRHSTLFSVTLSWEILLTRLQEVVLMWNRLQAYSSSKKVRQGYAYIWILQHERLHLGEWCTEESSRRIVGDRQKNLFLRLQNGKQTKNYETIWVFSYFVDFFWNFPRSTWSDAQLKSSLEHVNTFSSSMTKIRWNLGEEF